VLVVRKPAQDRAGPETGQAQPCREQRQQHLRIEESAPVEQRENKIAAGIGNQRFIAVGELQPDPDRLERIAHFKVIERVVAILVMQPALPEHVLGDQQNAKLSQSIGLDAGDARGRQAVRGHAKTIATRFDRCMKACLSG